MTKINKYKLFEYAYNELREEEMIEIEEAISKDPEALKIVNEYLLLKQNLKEIPLESFETILEKEKSKKGILDQLIVSAGKYIAWDIRPNLAFATFAFLLGVGIFQYNSNNNPYLNEREIAKVEQDYLLFKKGDTNSPWSNYSNQTFRSSVSSANCKNEYYSKKHLLLKICKKNNKFYIHEQTLLKKKPKK